MKYLLVILAMFSSSVSAFELQVANPVTQMVFNSEDYPNGVFLIEGYFLGCPYCNYNAKNVDELAEEMEHLPGVHVLDVGRDCRDGQYNQWITKHRPNHTVLKDCGGRKLLNRLKIRSFPTAVLLDCRGSEIYRTTGVWTAQVKEEIRYHITRAIISCD